jgi:hypothetical protein
MSSCIDDAFATAREGSMDKTKIVYLLFAAAVVIGTVDGHAATPSFFGKSAHAVASAPAAQQQRSAPQDREDIVAMATPDERALPPLPMISELRLEH